MAAADDGSPRHVPVIIIGAGPTGLTLANLLGVYGVAARLIERNASTVQEPRAVSIDDESLRTMQAAGLIDVVAETLVSGYGSEYRTPGGRCFLTVRPQGEPYGYPRRNAFRQPVLEAQLRDGLGRFPSIAPCFGEVFEDLEQTEAGVRIRVSDRSAREVWMSCDYLVGADGASSLVRRKLGLVLEGDTFGEKWLIVDLENSPSQSPETQVYCDVARPCIALPGPDQTRRFEFKLLAGETEESILAPAKVAGLLKTHGAHPGSVIKRAVVYKFHARIAPRWSQGRVFLAGDACHLTPPFAGQGMNSGIRDANNLAWKLAAVISGVLPKTILATYEQERRPHVGEMVQLALRMGRIVGPRSRLLGFATQFAFSALKVWPPGRAYFAEMKYKPKPRFKSGFVIPSWQSAKQTLVGRLLPQPVVGDRAGRPRRLDDHLGDHFALIGIGLEPAIVKDAAAGLCAQLGARLFTLIDRPVSPVDGVQHLTTKEGWLRDTMTGQFGLILLIRPDRYVAGEFRPDEAARFSAELERLCRGGAPCL